MIYAIGLGTDKTMQHFLRASAGLAPVTFVDLDELFVRPWRFSFGEREPSAVAPGLFERLDPEAGYYVRPIDLSPALISPWNKHWGAMLSGLSAFLESIPGRIANRPGAHSHNGSKPFHEVWLTRRGFDVPDAITTSDSAAIAKFLEDECQAICKTLCGVRGKARLVGPKDFASFEPVQGPVHLQRYVQGIDVRAHLIGSRCHAEQIHANGIDYRDPLIDSEHSPIAPPPSLVKRMTEAAEMMGLAFTGWDFKVDAKGRWWCLEVNPMPGYDGYDRRCGHAITGALVDWLGRA